MNLLLTATRHNARNKKANVVPSMKAVANSKKNVAVNAKKANARANVDKATVLNARKQAQKTVAKHNKK